MGARQKEVGDVGFHELDGTNVVRVRFRPEKSLNHF
jgi:hypothetical protein